MGIAGNILRGMKRREQLLAMMAERPVTIAQAAEAMGISGRKPGTICGFAGIQSRPRSSANRPVGKTSGGWHDRHHRTPRLAGAGYLISSATAWPPSTRAVLILTGRIVRAPEGGHRRKPMVRRGDTGGNRKAVSGENSGVQE